MRQREEISERVRTLIAEEFLIEAATIDEQTGLLNDIGLDSFNILEMLTVMEREFDIEVRNEEWDQFQTVGDVVDYIAIRKA